MKPKHCLDSSLFVFFLNTCPACILDCHFEKQNTVYFAEDFKCRRRWNVEMKLEGVLN